MSSHLESLETILDAFIENTRQVNIIVQDFQPQSQGVLHQKIQNIVQALQEIEKLRPSLMDVHVPLEVLEYIDKGKNPQVYTKDCIEKAVASNEEVKGKIDNYRKFKATLLVQMNEALPSETAKYRAMRGDDRPVS